MAGEKIQDNSFLIEEAYNQEDGVIQHIQMLQWDRNRGNWIYSFTEEWPTPRQNHQLSFTVPLSKLPGTGAGPSGMCCSTTATRRCFPIGSPLRRGFPWCSTPAAGRAGFAWTSRPPGQSAPKC